MKRSWIITLVRREWNIFNRDGLDLNGRPQDACLIFDIASVTAYSGETNVQMPDLKRGVACAHEGALDAARSAVIWVRKIPASAPVILKSGHIEMLHMLWLQGLQPPGSYAWRHSRGE